LRKSLRINPEKNSFEERKALGFKGDDEKNGPRGRAAQNSFLLLQSGQCVF